MNLPELPIPSTRYLGLGQVGRVGDYTADQLRLYAAEAVRLEREGCAALLEEIGRVLGGNATPTPNESAAAIRARGGANG